MMILLLQSALAGAISPSLSHTPAVPGETFTVSVSDVPAGWTVWLAGATLTGSGPCPPIAQGQCFSLGAGARPLGSAASTGADVDFDIALPPTLRPGNTLQAQALAISPSGTQVLFSPTMGVQVVAFGGLDTERSLIASSDMALGWVAWDALAGGDVSLWSDSAMEGDLGDISGGHEHGTPAMNWPVEPGAWHLSLSFGGHRALSDAYAVGAVVGCYWDGTVEHYAQLDPATGDVWDLGVVGDLAYWSGATVADAARNRFYAFGWNSLNQYKLWVLNARTGALIAELSPPRQVAAAEMAADGRIITVDWDGSAEWVRLLDPNDGSETDVAQVTGLATWSGQTALDGDLLYLVGNDLFGGRHLWRVNLFSGTLDLDLAVVEDLGLGLQAYDGDLFGLRWNGSAEELVRTDPDTGTTTVIGYAGDLAYWSGVTLAHEDELYVWGHNSLMGKMWVLDMDDGSLLREQAAISTLLGLQIAW